MLVDNGQFQEFTTSSDVYTFVCPSLFLWGTTVFELLSSCWTSQLPPPLIWMPASRNMFCLSEMRFWRVNCHAAIRRKKKSKVRVLKRRLILVGGSVESNKRGSCEGGCKERRVIWGGRRKLRRRWRKGKEEVKRRGWGEGGEKVRRRWGEGEEKMRGRWRSAAICRQEANPSFNHSSPSSLWHCPPLIKTHHSSGQKSYFQVTANKLNDCLLDSKFSISYRI